MDRLEREHYNGTIKFEEFLLRDGRRSHCGHQKEEEKDKTSQYLERRYSQSNATAEPRREPLAG